MRLIPCLGLSGAVQGLGQGLGGERDLCNEDVLRLEVKMQNLVGVDVPHTLHRRWW